MWIGGVAAALAVLAFVVFPVALGWALVHPRRAPVDTTPAAWGLAYRAVVFRSRTDRVPLSGWWIPAARPSPLAVILAHGYGDNRLDASVPGSALMRALHAMGANVLTFDFRASGESGGSEVSIGEFEVRDLLGAVDWTRRTHPAQSKRIVLLGFSMGAVVALMAGEADPGVSGVIADSPFAALGPYLRANLPVWTHLPSFPFDPVILTLVPLITGLDPAKVDPEAHMRAFGSRPVLLIAGTADRTIPDRNSLALARAAAPGQDVRLWLVPGAGHIQAFRRQPAAYLAHLYRFLRRLDPGVAPPPSVGALAWAASR
jgi:alpha-beta hydrolase superfamily lysophospholipase